MEALSDSEAVSNILSADLSHDPSLETLSAYENITVADGTTTIVRGALHDVPDKFGSTRIPLKFLIVEKSPFDVIIGCLTLEQLGSCID